jgi:peroxiredoxin
MAELIQVGQAAPDFTLKDQDEKDVTLSSFKGKNVVLAFYPLDWSPVCTTENTCLRDDLPNFESRDTVLLGISIDSVWSHKAWASSLGLKHQLLSDIHREVVKKYGLFIPEANIGMRATVIVDKEGTVRFVKVQPIAEARDNQAILKAIDALK